MRPPTIVFLIFIFNFHCPLTLGQATTKPQLQLATVYSADIDISQFWVSEKLDGVRAYWNGKQLLTRNGNQINAPAWFIENFPEIALDGELWIARQEFERVFSAVSKQAPIDAEWKAVYFMVFDLPDDLTMFDVRLARMSQLIEKLKIPHLQIIPQFELHSTKELDITLEQYAQQGAEGLMLHRKKSFYQNRRTDDLQKVKLYSDTEAKVVSYLPGKGKYKGMLGALLVELPNGIRFKIGTGFSDVQRKKPPEIGSTITFKYYGTTSKGIPRFASFMRIRAD